MFWSFMDQPAMIKRHLDELGFIGEKIQSKECGDIFEKLSPRPQKTLKSGYKGSREVSENSTKLRANRSNGVGTKRFCSHVRKIYDLLLCT